MNIYFDLHGVLGDFAGAVYQLFHPRDYPPYETATDYDLSGWCGVTPEVFHKSIVNNYYLWAEVPSEWLGLELATEVMIRVNAPVSILTKPYSPAGYAGTLAWQQRHMPDVPISFAKDKRIHAHPRALLVDDHDGNIDGWRARGGVGILYPQPWNSRRGDKQADVRDELLEVLEGWT